MRKLKLLGTTFIIYLLLLPMAYGQGTNKQVQGVVSDDDGTVPGITISEKGMPGNGTATDVMGKFKIILKGNTGILVLGGVGYQPMEVNVAGKTNLTIKIKAQTKNLSEVVVVGYGTQIRQALTTPVSSVSGTELRDNPSVSLQNTLSGKVSGFFSQQRLGQPGQDGAAFFIRGVSSFTSDNQPLIIVDDIEVSYDQFSRLDANEVETISILKDASATAIYGIKGANGVLLVTTRRGKIGPPNITVRSEFSFVAPTVMPNYLDAYNTALLYNQAQINDNNNLPTPAANFQPKYTPADLALFQNGQDPYGHPNIDWKNEIFKKFSTQQRENLDASGGTEKVKYFVSLGFANQNGITKDYSTNQGIDGNYYYHRYNYRSNIDMKVTNTLNLKIDLFGNIGETNSPYVNSGTTSINGGKNDAFYDYSSYLSLAPYAYPIKNPDGSWGYSLNQVNNGYNANNIIERLSLGGYTRRFENNTNFVSAATQDLGFITKGLSAKGTVSYASTYIYGRSETRGNYPSFIYDPVANTYTPRDANIYRIDKFGLGYTPGSTVRQLGLQAFLNYERTFSDNHITALVLFNRTSLTKYIDAGGNSGTPTGNNPDQTYNFIPNNSQGITTSLKYDYKQKYLLTVSGAYNGSDRFSSDKRYGLFPAVSAGWNIAEEPFFKNNIKFIDQLKLRGSYGLVGSDRIGNQFTYAYLQQYTLNNGIQQASFGTSHNASQGVQEGTLPNSNVTWEKQRELDLGVDFSLFNGKVFGLVDYFDNNRYDILTTRGTISPIFGQNLPPVNLGKTNNHGLEIELNYHNKINKDLSYSLRGTFSYAHNKIIFQDEPAVPYDYQAATGHSIGAGNMFIWTGRYFKDQADIANTPHLNGVHPGDLVFADVNGDGVIDANDKGFFGSPNLPEKNYGLQFSARYKGFAISALFQAATNFSVSAFSEAIRPFTSNLMAIHQQAWTPDLGDNARYQALTLGSSVSDAGTNSSTYYNISGNYIRLKTADISYSLPKQWIQRIGVKDAKIYLNGYNLLTWSKAFNLYALDPEVNPGTDRINYPPSKTYNLGVSVTF